jgi:Flp pilus assembly protein TadD
VLARNPQDALAYRHLGFALGELGRYADAIDKFQQAATLNPQDTGPTMVGE